MSNTIPPKPPANIVELVETFLRMARSQLTDKGMVVPAVLVCHGDDAEVLTFDPTSDHEKNQVAFMGRELAQVLDAHTVVMVGEGWTLRTAGHNNYAALRAKYGSVATMPGRIEVVNVNVETRAGQVWQCQARIMRKGRAIKTGPVDYADLTGLPSRGRFAGWFAPERKIPDPDDLQHMQP